MLKSELEPWCIVEFGDGTKWLRVGNTDALINNEDGNEDWNTLSEYNEDLTYYDKFGDEDTTYDIIKVYNYDGYTPRLISDFLNNGYIYDKKANVERKYVSATERNKTIADFIASHEVEYNQSKQVTTVDPVKYPVPFWHCGIFNYLVYRGQADEHTKDTAFPSIFTLFHYSGRNWIHINKIIFSTKSNSWTYYVDEQRNDQVVSGGVHEFIYVPFAKVLNGMRIVIDGENPQIELIGDKGSKVIPLNSDDITNIKKYINLYENI